MSDFTYRFNDGFYTIFPENKRAEQTINAIIVQFGANKLTPTEMKAFRSQARKAKYTVRLASSTTTEDAELLAALNE